jgi:thiol-disulfide isomerase/thioredoxin
VKRRGTAASLFTLLLLSACGVEPDSVAAQARSGDRQGYVAGDGSVQRTSPDRRDAPLVVRGTTLEGNAWELSAQRGKVVVMNVWGSWCGPCLQEAPELESAWTRLSASRPVQFMGLDFREGPEAGAAFQRVNKITYPSLVYDGGAPVLGLRGLAPTVPTTLVIDAQGRVAARVLGATTAATLTGLVEDVLAEGATPP